MPVVTVAVVVVVLVVQAEAAEAAGRVAPVGAAEAAVAAEAGDTVVGEAVAGMVEAAVVVDTVAECPAKAIHKAEDIRFSRVQRLSAERDLLLRNARGRPENSV